MAKSVDVKICGLRSEADIRAAISSGARWLGFVHFPKSPRHIAREDGAALVTYARQLKPTVETVILLVDPDPDFAVEIADDWGVDHIQLHGRETNETFSLIRAERPSGELWKAFAVTKISDLDAVTVYPAADRFLFDAQPPVNADRPGGWGHSFDWTILTGFACDRPWILAGGLKPDNVTEAIRISGARAVDVSSGVEAEKGVKSAELIEAFCAAVHPEISTP